MTTLDAEYYSRHISDTVKAMLAYWDKNLVCRYANKAYADWFGVSSQQLVDKMTLDQLLGPRLFALNLPFITKALNGEVQTFERDLTTPSGERKNTLATYYPDIEDQQVKGLIVHVAETTFIRKIQETEKKLFESRELFEKFMETSPVPAWIRDTEGVMRYMNQAYMRCFNKNAREIGKSIQEIFSLEVAAQFLNTTHQVLESNEPVESMLEVLDEHQHATHYKLIRFPLVYQDRKIIAGWAMDLTEQVNAHEQMLRLEEEKRREVLRSVIETQESEREAISKRIHEQTAQTLSSCKWILDSLIASNPDREILETAGHQLQTAISDLQHICDTLTSLTLLDMGLEDALKENIADIVKRYDIILTMARFDTSIESIGAAEKLNIFRIVSDLLNVMVKYAHASSIRMSFFYQPGGIQLRLDYTGDAFGKLSNTRELQNVKDRMEFYDGILRYDDSRSSRSIDICLVRNANLVRP